MRIQVYVLLITIMSFLSCTQKKAPFEPNYDETKIPEYELPAILNGSDWETERRPEILALFEQEEYGKVPDFEYTQEFTLLETDSMSLDGKAIRKQVNIKIGSGDNFLDVHLLIYQPVNVEMPPVFVGYNFYGNHTIHADTNILLAESWVMNNEEFHIDKNKATPESRGVRSHRWPVELIIENGYAVATLYYGDIDPDFDDGFKNGIHGLISAEPPAADEWGSIAAWAWGLSRVMDYFETDPEIDHNRSIVIGHSRLGKTSLWAGASDTRFSMVVSNCSGCGGAALSRRQIGETVGRINNVFPHWFCDNYTKYNENEDKSPVDQHMLIALIAPRPVYVASATEDQWADPKGEFLAAMEASQVYKHLGAKGMKGNEMPDPDNPLDYGTIGYHIRTGKHDITPWDWQQYINFADFHLKYK
jgi:hypothetical protein